MDFKGLEQALFVMAILIFVAGGVVASVLLWLFSHLSWSWSWS